MLKTTALSFKHLPGSSELFFPDLQCKAGSTLLVLGKSGSGKTTLLSLMAGLLFPLKGEIEIDGVDTNKLSRSDWDQFRGHKIGMIFQNPYFIHSLTAYENLALALKFGGHREGIGTINPLLDKLGILHLAGKFPKQLSQGEKQRLGIARAIIKRPILLLADEPTSALDDDLCSEVVNLLVSQTELNNAALVLVTHDSRLKSMFANRIEL